MPYLVTEIYYQPDKVDEVAKGFFEMMVKYPLDESLGDLILLGANIRTANGIKAMGIVNVKKGKLEETKALVENQMAMLRNIYSFNSKSEVWNTLEEGLAPLGLSMPT